MEKPLVVLALNQAITKIMQRLLAYKRFAQADLEGILPLQIELDRFQGLLIGVVVELLQNQGYDQEEHCQLQKGLHY